MSHTPPPLGAATLDDLVRGYVSTADHHACLHCATRFARGQVHPDGALLLTARGAIRHHLAQAHGGPFAALIARGKAAHGLSDVQVTLLSQAAAGASDAEIATALGGRALSTVRNHRHQLKQRAQEARILLALLTLMESQMSPDSELLTFHPALPVDDDRTRIHKDEARALLDHYFEDAHHTVLRRIPKKEKHKLVVLRQLVERFQPGQHYTERQVNALLEPAHEDVAALRRYLVDYRFMAREKDGTAYWRTDG